MRKAAAEHRIKDEMRRCRAPIMLARRSAIAWRAVADTAQPSVAGSDDSFEHRLHLIAEHQVGMADDAQADTRFSVAAACAHRGSAIGELHLTDRPHRSWTFSAIHRTRFHE